MNNTKEQATESGFDVLSEWVKFKRLVERTPTGFTYSEGLPEFIGFDAMAFRPFRTAQDCADWIAQERPGCVVEWNIQRE